MIAERILNEAAAKSGRRLTVKQHYFSRRGDVYRVAGGDETYILKIFPDGGEKTEFSVLERCRELGLPAPAAVVLGDGWLLRRYLPGTLLTSLVESDGPWPLPLAKGVSRLAAAGSGPTTLFSPPDVNARNLLVHGEELFFLDWDGIMEEPAEVTLGRIFAAVSLLDVGDFPRPERRFPEVIASFRRFSGCVPDESKIDAVREEERARLLLRRHRYRGR